MESSSSRPAKSFKDMRVWQEAYKLSIRIYKICGLPRHEQYSLTSQMCRSAVSVCSNIAEGFGRRSIKEKDQFYSMANGSLTELENQILIAKGIDYIRQDDYELLIQECERTHKKLTERKE